MFCNHCGAENADAARFCTQCGKAVLEEAPRPPDAETPVHSHRPQDRKPELWNPNAIANWSLLFTPVFGAWLVRANWNELGDTKQAGRARGWFWLSLIFVAGAAFVSAVPLGAGFLYLLVWYVASARPQARYVKERLDNDYRHRGWGAPLLAAMLVVGALIFVYSLLPNVEDSLNRVGESRRPGSGVPACSENETVELVNAIAGRETARQFGQDFRDRAAGEYIAEQFEFDIQSIRTIGRLDRGGRECAAKLAIRGEESEGELEITYTVELTDDREGFYVTVYGL